MRIYVALVVFSWFSVQPVSAAVCISREDAARAQDTMLRVAAVLKKTSPRSFSYLSSPNIEVRASESAESCNSKFARFHKDIKDYVFYVNGAPVDLDKLYIPERGQSNQWVRVASLVDPEFYRDRINNVVYAFKAKDIPAAASRRDLQEVGTISFAQKRGRKLHRPPPAPIHAPTDTVKTDSIIPPVSGSGMVLMEDQVDQEYNQGKVYAQLRQIPSAE